MSDTSSARRGLLRNIEGDYLALLRCPDVEGCKAVLKEFHSFGVRFLGEDFSGLSCAMACSSSTRIISLAQYKTSVSLGSNLINSATTRTGGSFGVV